MHIAEYNLRRGVQRDDLRLFTNLRRGVQQYDLRPLAINRLRFRIFRLNIILIIRQISKSLILIIKQLNFSKA